MDTLSDGSRRAHGLMSFNWILMVSIWPPMRHEFYVFEKHWKFLFWHSVSQPRKQIISYQERERGEQYLYNFVKEGKR